MDVDDVAAVGFDMTKQVSPVVLQFLNTPRFGRGNNITVLFDAGSSDQKEYSRGLMIAGILTVTVYLFWLFLLFIFYCLGHDTVGFLSGEPFHRKVPVVVKRGLLRQHSSAPHTYITSSQASTATESVAEGPPPRETWSLNNRPARVRLLFISCGLCFVIAAIWLFARGVANLQHDVMSIQQSALDLDKLVRDASLTYETGVRNIAIAANDSFQAFRREKERRYFCPDKKAIGDDSVAAPVYDLVMQSLRDLQVLKDLIGARGMEIEQSLIEAASVTSNLSFSLESRAITEESVLLLSIPYTVVPALLVAGAILALSKTTSKNFILLLEYACAPLFFLMVAAAWGVAAYLSIAAGANADFCMPDGEVNASPDEAIQSILRAQGMNAGMLTIVTWFVSQCAVKEDPFLLLRAAVPELILGVSSLSNLTTAISKVDEARALSDYCSRDYSDLLQHVLELKEFVVLLSAAGTQTLDTLSCERIVPVYADAVYSQACSSVPTDLFWVFCGCIALGILGMIMITTRASWQATVFEYPSREPVLSLEDSIGQILAEDELSHATSELSEQQSLRTKMEAFNAVTNMDFVKDEEANRIDTFALDGSRMAQTARNLNDKAFAACFSSGRRRFQRANASLAPSAARPAGADLSVSGALAPSPSMWQGSSVGQVSRVSMPFPNPQAGDLSINGEEDNVPDPPLLDIDDDYSDSDAVDDNLISKEVRILGPSLLRGTFIEAGFDEGGQEMVLSETDVSSDDKGQDIAPNDARFRSSAVGSLSLSPVVGMPNQAEMDDDDFFVPDDVDRQLWKSVE